MLALPTIWLVNRDEAGQSSTRPNVAVVGIDPAEVADATWATAERTYGLALRSL